MKKPTIIINDEEGTFTPEDVADAKLTILFHRVVLAVCMVVLVIGGAVFAREWAATEADTLHCEAESALDVLDVDRGLRDGSFPAPLHVDKTPRGTLVQGRKAIFLVVDGHVVGATTQCTSDVGVESASQK